MRYHIVVTLLIVFVSLGVNAAEDDGEGPVANDPLPPSEAECLGEGGNATVFVDGECQCAPGFEQIGTLVVTENEGESTYFPNCMKDDDSSPFPGSGGDPEEVPREPQPNPQPELTLIDCRDDFATCSSNLDAVARQCQIQEMMALKHQINNGQPCFGQPGFSLWNSIVLENKDCGIFGCEDLICDDITMFEESEKGRACTNAFRKQATIICQDGQEKGTRQSGHESSSGASYIFQVDSKTSGSFTQSTEPSEGVKSACWRNAITEGMPQCKAEYDQCVTEVLDAAAGFSTVQTISGGTSNQLASGTGNQLALGTGNQLALETIDRLLSRIDRALLGFAESGGSTSGLENSSGISANGKPFRSLSRAKYETSYNYENRLRFLVKWSDFIKRINLNPTKQEDMQKAFVSYQFEFQRHNDFDSGLLALRFTTDAITGRIGTDDSRVLYDEYLNRGGFLATIFSAEKLFMEKISGLMSSDEFASFLEKVWPGAISFGVSMPMSLKSITNQQNLETEG